MIMIILEQVKKVPSWVWLGGAAVVALYVIKKGSIENAAAGVTAGAVKGVTGLATGAVKGSVIGIAEVFGIPSTKESQCQVAIRNGANYEASKYCSAGIFARWQYLSAIKKATGKTFTMQDIFN